MTSANTQGLVTDIAGLREQRGHAPRLHRLAGDDPGARQPVRRRDRRPPVHPRRCRAGQADAVRRHDRARLPDPVADGPGDAAADEGHRRDDGRELRARPGPLPGAAARRGAVARRRRRSSRSPTFPAAFRSRSAARSRSRTRRSRPASPSRSCGSTAAAERCDRRRDAGRDRRSRSRRAEPRRGRRIRSRPRSSRPPPLFRRQPAAAERAGGRRLLPRAEHARGHLHRRRRGRDGPQAPRQRARCSRPPGPTPTC